MAASLTADFLCIVSAQEKPSQIIEEELAAARAEAESESSGSGKKVDVADKLFIAEREARIAREIARLAMTARGSAEQMQDAIALRRREAQGAPPEELNKLADAVRRAAEHDQKIVDARIQLSSVLMSLTAVKDPRTVRLTAPLLNEDQETLLVPGMPIPGIQESAAHSLRILGLAKIVNLGLGEYPSISDLRAWWATNRERFGPVPKPLSDLKPPESNRGAPDPPESAKSQSNPVTSPPPDLKEVTAGRGRAKGRFLYPALIALFALSGAALLLKRRVRKR